MNKHLQSACCVLRGWKVSEEEQNKIQTLKKLEFYLLCWKFWGLFLNCMQTYMVIKPFQNPYWPSQKLHFACGNQAFGFQGYWHLEIWWDKCVVYFLVEGVGLFARWFRSCHLLCDNFVSQLGWPLGAQTKHDFWVCLWESLGILAFDLVRSVKQVASPCWQTLSNPRRAKRWRKEEFALFPASLIEPGCPISSSPALDLGLRSLAVLILRPSDSDWILPLAFLGLLLIINKFLMMKTFMSTYLCTYTPTCTHTYTDSSSSKKPTLGRSSVNPTCKISCR